jgi:hypothetical protein
MKLIIEIIGWMGSIEILVAYGLNSYQKIKSDSRLFYFLNLTGGLLLTVYTIYKGAFASTFINVVWVIIAAIAIVKMIKRNQHK